MGVMLTWLMNLDFAGSAAVGGAGELTSKLHRTSEIWLTRVTTEWLTPFLFILK